VEELDSTLRERNSDYDAKRASVMYRVSVEVVPRGTFHRWQIHSGRRKVPRMMADSVLSDEVLATARERVKV
ncbi:MAG: hypothetical protein IIW44_07120, partial [Alistipes sp.]|nr:hypothetical protein [Alistipes sp.]